MQVRLVLLLFSGPDPGPSKNLAIVSLLFFGGLIRADCTSLIDLLADKELALSVGSAANG